MTLEDERQATLLLFKAGGARFAVEAASVQRIASADWRPDPSGPDDTGAQVVSLSAELGLPVTAEDRTLVVDADGGAWGFKVDSIDSEVLGDFKVHPVPQLLARWMEPVVISGVADRPSPGELVHVLDLRALVHHIQGRAQKVSKGKPG